MTALKLANTDHVLLTRFNLPSKGYESLIRAREGWLRERLVLFEENCLPSIRNQTQCPAGWIIYFDPQSPPWLMDRISEVNLDGIFTPIFRAEVSRADLMQDIESLFNQHGDFLLTTNVDNDDGLACDFVERLQTLEPVAQSTAIYFTNGLIKSPQGVYAHEDRNNAFCSVLTPWRNPSTCWADWHNLLGQSMPAIRLQGAPAWLQVVHGANVSNRVHGKRVSPTTYAAQFPGLLVDAAIPTKANLLMDLVVSRPARSMREILRGLAKSVIQATSGRDRIDKLKFIGANLVAMFQLKTRKRKTRLLRGSSE